MNQSASPADILELSNSQKLILAGQRLQPGDPLYNMVFTFRIEGAVDTSRFERAFRTLVQSCETLRTVLIETAAGPGLRVLLQPAGVHEFEDLSGLDDVESKLAGWLAGRSQLCFDITRETFDSALLRLGPQQYIWYFNQHHLLTDAWSVSLLFSKLEQLYRASQASALEDPVTELRSAHQAAPAGGLTPNSRVTDQAAKYWEKKQQLGGKCERFYRERPVSVGGRTRRVPCHLGPERSRLLAALISRPGFASFNRELASMQVIATVLFAYLHRLGGRDALAVGVPSHSRISPELKESVGLLINVFPLRLQIDPQGSFAELYAQLARANQELMMYAGSEVVSARDNRAFDVLLNFIPSGFSAFAGMPVSTDWVHSGFGDSNHLLRLQVHDFDRTGEFTLLFDLNEDAIVGSERQWVIEHFLRLFDAMLDDPEAKIAECPLLPPGQLPSLALPANPWPRRRENAGTVLDLIESQFIRCPADTALSCEGDSCSYGELAERSAGIAARLNDLGIEPGAVVAVLLPRSIELVVAALGILRAGATLLPLDPAYPQARNSFFLEDSATTLLITAGDGSEQLQWPPERTLAVEDELRETADPGRRSAACLASAADGAYIIYTSGSTGNPKGVLVRHRALNNYISWARDYYLDQQPRNFPLFTPVCFDLTLTSLFAPLSCGGTLVIYPEPPDSGEITVRKVIEDNIVDVIKLTPAHLSLIRTMDLSRSRLRKIIVGGEDFKVEVARSVSDYLGGEVDIYNEYGPTETTVGCTVHRYSREDDTAVSVPIGRPITNAEVYLLDAGGNPVPRGVSAELYISGVGVAEGYLNRPELTAERFVPDPFETGMRMYRSGDVARWSHRGYLEYLGRADRQVKIRGVRIETGEIESAISALERVREAVVDVLEPQEALDAQADDRRCHRCGIEGRHPAAQLDESSLCRLCRVYERNRVHAEAYFRPLEELRERIATVRAQVKGKQDSVMLLSGGKDSSYALCRLVDLGLTPLVFTLDNGYISEGAMQNVRRLVDRLGLELIVGSTPAMDRIFVDSLTRHSNVCNGCFKTIYTLSTKLARERGINTICTGLSRGQIFETRVAHLFQQGIYDPQQIDRSIVDARKAYHRVDDVIARTMDVSVFDDDAVFDEIDYLDFYRYTEVTLDEIYAYLNTRAPWIRPSDTGRSTNCLINDVGIYVHKHERGYHNYALPYSWDVRLGHKQREAAVEELEDELDTERVGSMLRDIGYKLREPVAHSKPEKQLVAYYVSAQELPLATLREQLARVLPLEYIPRQFIRLPELPLTANGKVDREALPRPQLSRQDLGSRYAMPRSATETVLTDIWKRMLALDDVGIDDSFFELGGDSIINVQIVAAAQAAGVTITPQQLFDHPTVRLLAAVAGSCEPTVIDQSPVVGAAALLPSQQRYFDCELPEPDQFCQSVVLHCEDTLEVELIHRALTALVLHHDALRSRFTRFGQQWRQTVLPPDEVSPEVVRVDVVNRVSGALEAAVDTELGRLRGRLDLARGQVVAATCLLDEAGRGLLLLAVNHLVMDGVSWWILLEDLAKVCRQLQEGREPALPPKSISAAQWASELRELAQPGNEALWAYWRRPVGAVGQIPCDRSRLALNTLESVQILQTRLDRAASQCLVRQVPANFGVQVQDVLCTALLRTLQPWTGSAAMGLEIEGHGRKNPGGGAEPLRTIGWFTSFYTLVLELPTSSDIGDELRAVKEQLRSVPDGGVSYGAIRYYASDSSLASELAAQPTPEFLFNYLGQWESNPGGDSRFRFDRPIQAHVASQGRRRHLLELNVVIFDGQLQVDWSFSKNLHPVSEIETLAATFIEQLRDLIDWCVATQDSGLTPSDFPDAAIDQQQLDSLLEEFGE